MKILVTNYTFNKTAKTVTFTDYANIRLDSILLITNATRNIIIYNFADPLKGGTIATNVLTLTYDTSAQADADKLMIFYQDETVNQLVTASAGTNLNTSLLALEAGNLASIKAAVEIIDNFISGTKGLVTEDNSAAIKTAVEAIDNFISGARGLVTEDNSAAIKTSVELIDDTIKTDDAAFTPGTTKVIMAGAEFDDTSPDSVDEGDAGAIRMSANRNLYMRIRDNAGNERGMNIDANGEPGISAIRSALPAGSALIGKVGIDQTTPGTTNAVVEASAAAILAKVTAAAASFVKLEDAASASADGGVPSMAIRKATPANLSDTDGDYEMLQMSAGRVWVSNAAEATENFLGFVGGKTVVLSSSITMSAAGSYATGDYIGTTTSPQSFANAVRVSAGTGIIKSLTISDKIVTANVAMELWLFSATFTAPTDNAAWAISDAEALTVLGVIPILASNWYASSNNQIYFVDNLSIPIKPAATSLFYALVARGTTPSFTSADLQLTLGILQD